MSQRLMKQVLNDAITDNVEIIHKFGRTSAANGVFTPVVSTGVLNFLTTARQVRIKAGGNINDTASGTGARSVLVIGLDETGIQIMEVLTTAGVVASAASVNTFIRVYRVVVVSVGEYGGTNADSIFLETADGVTDLLEVVALKSQSKFCAYTIPLGKVGYLKSVFSGVDSNKTVDVQVLTRESILNTTAPFDPKRVRIEISAISGVHSTNLEASMIELTELTDIWVEASGNSATADVSASLEILIFDV